MEDEQSIRDKKSILHLYNNILPKLAASIHKNLGEVTPLFHDFSLERIVDTWTKGPDTDSDTPISIENGNVQQLGLRLRLEGFQSAGAPPFDLTKDLLFKLDHTTYEVKSDKKDVLAEKLYYQTWSESEVGEVAQKWCEELIDEITQRLESLT